MLLKVVLDLGKCIHLYVKQDPLLNSCYYAFIFQIQHAVIELGGTWRDLVRLTPTLQRAYARGISRVPDTI